jgi:hypothetical protein
MDEYYRYCIEWSDFAERQALAYRNVREIDLARFWHNASVGFKERALSLSEE